MQAQLSAGSGSDKMGSIYGLFDATGGIAFDRLLAMSESLQHRVHDRAWTWADPHCAMGAALLHITPGTELEKAPSAEPGANDTVISCDARIDNREELIKKFDLGAAIVCDSELILKLYEICGEECVDHLIGAFAFAIYDSNAKTLFCARDHFGEKPFSYALVDGRLAFASEPRGVVASGLVDAAINEKRILSLLAMNPDDVSSTAYKGINRLPAAHALTITGSELRVWRYWEPQIPATPVRMTDEETAAQFIALLRSAVFCRLRSTKPVGACLSGGLDSSTIVMLAREAVGAHSPANVLTTFSATFPSVPGSDEEQWISIVEKADGAHLAPVAPSRHPMDQFSPMTHTAAIVAAIDEPTLAPNLFQIWELASQAKAQGIGVLLGGHDGDTVVSHGFALITELTLGEEWAKLSHELTMLNEFLGNYEGQSNALVEQYAVPCVKHLILKGALPQAFRTAKVLNGDYGIPIKSMLGAIMPRRIKRIARQRRIGRGKSGIVQLSAAAKKSPHYLNSVPVASEAWRPSAHENHLQALKHPLVGESFEFFDRIGARLGIEHRHPFFDKRLVEFCLSLPIEQKIRRGWTRAILRDSTKSILPEPIRLRKDKSNLGHNFATSLVNDLALISDAFLNPPPGLEAYWDLQKLIETLERYRGRPNGMDALVLHLSYSHAQWLRNWP